MKPYWAGLAVVMIAATAEGQNIHKGILRILGTIPGVLAAMVIFSFAAQDRWLFITLASIWMFFVTYLMLKDERRSYMWNAAGFVCLVILTTHPESSLDIFNFAINRVLETIMGVVVYTLVTVFVFPQTNINTLKQISADLLSTQIKLLNLSVLDINISEGKDTQSKLTKQQMLSLKSLKQAVYAKSSDSYEVNEAMPLWKKFHYLCDISMKTTNQLHNGVVGFSNIDVDKLAPNLKEYKNEIALRLEMALEQFNGKRVDYKHVTIELEVNQEYLDGLNSFDKIAFIAIKKELNNLQRLSMELLQCTQDILDTSTITKVEDHRERESSYHFFIIDKENLKASLHVALSTFVGFLIMIYIDPPGHNGWYMMLPILGMIMALSPQINASKFVPPIFFTMLYALFIYSVIMPHLSSYVGLGALIGFSIGAILYYYPPPMRVFGYASIIFIVSVENQQVYDFAQQANTLVYLIAVFTFNFVFAYLLSSSRPEKKVLSLMHRYFKNAELLISELQLNKDSFLKKLKLEFYLYELRTLPPKLEAWTRTINYTNFSKNDAQKVGLLISNIYYLSNSLEELIKSSRLSQSDVIFKETSSEIFQWNKAIEEILKEYALNLDKDPTLHLQERLQEHKQNAEYLINTHLHEARLSKISNQEKEHIYQLIGSYQGITHALIGYADVAHTIKLNNFKEEYFS